ncbi:TRAP transporter substrate-binding protein [Salicibibacter cibi]|uniref:TRAP transporter substrate-binding protein n=2 Tax=Salicibibacter cibi TaxID=2743001 RepID=A0A7T6ZE40_9BACI|nr:TRAP transporter substrate-binding protein [Salicibibacter cibi]
MVASMVALAGCGEESAGSENGGQTIRVAHYFAEDHPHHTALTETFKPLVEENSDGEITVEIFPDSQLGAEEEFYESVQAGTVEMGVPGMIMQDAVEKLAVPEWPFLFDDYDHVQKVLNGEIGDELTEDLEEIHGVKDLAWSANGFRMISSNQPIESMEDLDGLRLRTPNITNYVELGEQLGATISPLPIDEIYTALEQGVIDAQENPIASVRASAWYEVQSEILESEHMFSPNLYVINLDFWNELSEKHQQIVEKAAAESAEDQFELMENSYEEDKEYLEGQGVNFTTPSEEFQEQMSEASEPMYEEFYAEFDWAEDIVQRIGEEAE